MLRREKIDDCIEVDLDTALLDRNQGALGTYQEIKTFVQQQTGLLVSSLYIAQVKRKCGIIERANYNLGNQLSKVPSCPPEKEQAIREALKYFGMI